ncbi:MAG: flagellar hook-length control protein FliK [Caldilineaceae bacterium]|nr:flagellar hook-length control protein FliK [Caldilineaceae bacterium]HRJ42406.1 flagellar hook-length control protein FliK [Caldilineaceae bacterium]
MTSGDKALTGSGGSLGKATAPSSAEMRSAFEAMMGSLLGMLGTGQPMAVIPLPESGGRAGSGLAGTGDLTGKPALESLYTLINGKVGQPGLTTAAPIDSTLGDTPLAALAAASTPSAPALSADQLASLAGVQQKTGDTGQASEASQTTVPQASGEGEETAALPLLSQMSPGQEDAGNSGKESEPSNPAALPVRGESAPTLSSFAVGTQASSAPTADVTGSKSGTPVSATPTDQIGEQVQVSLSRGENEATIQLHPRELGSVRIRLQMENGQLHLSIRAEQQETGRLLNSKLADLRQSLEGQGIRVGELAVARSERTLASEAASREIAPGARSGQMDMNPNGSQSQRQPMTFGGGNFGNGSFSPNQNSQGQPQVAGGERVSAVGGTAEAEARRGSAASRGPAGVDYYV